MATKKTTMHQAREGFLAHLKADGKKDATLYTYAKDLDLVEAHFGEDRELGKLLPAHVGRFAKSDLVLKKPSGAPRAERTVAKTLRVFRMMLAWAVESDRLAKLPLPKDYPTGRGASADA